MIKPRFPQQRPKSIYDASRVDSPNHVSFSDQISLEQEIVDYARQHPEDLGTVGVEEAHPKKEGDMGQLIMDLMKAQGPDPNPDKPKAGGASNSQFKER